MTTKNQNEAVVFALFAGLFAVLSVPAGLYLLSFGWLAQGILGFIGVSIAGAVCLMPFWCGWATYQKWHGNEVVG